MNEILNPIKLKFFDEDIENQFLNYYFNKKLLQQRIALISGSVLYLLFSFLDLLLIPEKKVIFLSLRILVMFPVALSTFLLTYHKIYRRYSQHALLVTNFIGAFVIIIMIIIAKPPVTYLYYAGEILVIIYAFTFSGQRFIWSFGLSILVIATYQIAGIVTDTPLKFMINNNFFFISANFLSLVASYIIESTMRNDFYNSLLLKKEKEKVTGLNKKLEQTVELRTEELKISNHKLKKELIKSNELNKQQLKLQDQLVQSQKMQAIGYLAGGVAHDFNNLLTVINGYAELLLKDLYPDDNSYEPIEEIFNAGNKAADLTKQLLAFSRKQILLPEIVELNDLIKNFEKMIKRLIETNIQIEFNYSNEDLKIKVDPRQLEQVILNLVVNARDAMPEGGKLTLKTSTIVIEKDDTIYRKNSAGTYALLSIGDNGFGIDESNIEHIFEPFFTTKEVGKGTGLGLSTVYGIIAQSEGHIYVNSEVNVGTKFSILFPLYQNEVIKEKQGIETIIDYNGSGLILIVEDNKDVRSYLEMTLKNYGYDTIATEDYNEALPVFEKLYKTIDLVISDIMLPGKSGEKIIEEFQAIHKDLKYILISGYVNNILNDKSHIKQGNFIQKPFTQEQLMTKIHSLIN